MDFQEIPAHGIHFLCVFISRRTGNITVDDDWKVSFENCTEGDSLPGHSLSCDPEQIASISLGFGFVF